MTEGQKSSTLKTVILLVGVIVALAVVGFIALVAIEIISSRGENTAQPSSETTEEINENNESVKLAESVNDKMVFSGQGYIVEYPKDWIYEVSGDNTVIFSGPEGTDEYYTTVTLQTLFSKEVGGKYDSLEELYRDLYRQFEQVGGRFLVYEENTHFYKGNNYPTISFDATYELNGEAFWQYIILFERDQGAYHLVFYTTPLDLELSIEPFAEMVGSIIFAPIQ